MTDPTYRMSMLPLGTYANPDGSESLGLAVPGMLQEPFNALAHLFGTPSHPGTFTQGPDAPGNADAMRTLLLSTYGGNALNPARAAESVLPQLLSDTGKPSLMGSALEGMKDQAQAAYRILRYPFENATVDNAGMMDLWQQAAAKQQQVFNAQNLVGAQDHLIGHINDRIDALNSGNDIPHRYNDFGEPEDPLTPYDTASLNALLRQRMINDGTLFSDTGSPSLFGSALSSLYQDQQNDSAPKVAPRNALLGY